jgi:hypothetical protein
MSSTQLETLRWQFQLTWKLADMHLPALTDDACLWEPAQGCWTVRRSADGRWRPDWVDAEPDRPGGADAVERRLEALSTEWSDVLSRLNDGDLERPLAYPWREPRPLRLVLAWANAELMKNVAEIGYVRLLFAASRDRR